MDNATHLRPVELAAMGDDALRAAHTEAASALRAAGLLLVAWNYADTCAELAARMARTQLAAGFAYDEHEFAKFAAPDYGPERPRRWLLLPRADAEHLSGFRR